MVMYLKAKTNGIILEYHEVLAQHEDWKVVTEQEAFPEKFAPVDLASRETKVILTVDTTPVTPTDTVPIELASQKGRLFSTVDEVQAVKSAKAKTATVNVTGLKGEF